MAYVMVTPVNTIMVTPGHNTGNSQLINFMTSIPLEWKVESVPSDGGTVNDVINRLNKQAA